MSRRAGVEGGGAAAGEADGGPAACLPGGGGPHPSIRTFKTAESTGLDLDDNKDKQEEQKDEIEVGWR